MLTKLAKRLVSKNKRRLKTEDGRFDLDLSYITEHIIAMGFPAGDRSSGVRGFVEGFYRNHMRDVIGFLDQYHAGAYKIYNLCSERTYNASLFDGKVASFPFDDHNCPPLQLISSFCHSCKDWLRQSMDNIVVVHCKAGKSRTGLMVCCLLLYLGHATTAEEAMALYNLKRTKDGKGLTLPSQQRYLRYYELVLHPEDGGGGSGGGDAPRRTSVGEPLPQPLVSGAKFIRSVRLHHHGTTHLPHIFVKDHYSERLLFSSMMLSGKIDDKWTRLEPLCVEFVLPFPVKVCDDFKVKFLDKKGEYYTWLHTAYIQGNQVMLEASDLDRYKYREKPINWSLLVELNFHDGAAP